MHVLKTEVARKQKITDREEAQEGNTEKSIVLLTTMELLTEKRNYMTMTKN